MHTCSSQNQQIIHLVCQKKSQEKLFSILLILYGQQHSLWIPILLQVHQKQTTKNVSSLPLRCTATGFLQEYEMIKCEL